MHSISKLALAGVLLMAGSVIAMAEEEREFGWSVTIGGTSDYVFRGVSLTQEDPAAQGSIDMSYGIFYAGAWASNIDSGAYEPWELDLYAGIKPVLGPVTFDFGVVGYFYPADSADNDYVELKAGAAMELVKDLSGGIALWYQPDQQNAAEVYTIEGTLAYTLPQVGIFAPTVSGLLGYTEDTENTGWFSNTADSYTYWNAGLTLGVDKFSLDFRYWDTNLNSTPIDGYYGLDDERFVFSAKVTLP